MYKLPLRKCLYLAKVALVFLLVFAVLTSIERWRGGKRTARAQDLDLDSVSADDFEAQVLADEARIVPGLGEGGVAAYLYGRDKELGIESEKKLAINVYLSDRIAYNRSLDDHRNPACKRVVYDAELPSVSVIIIFHNEPYSVVVRTLHSVINSVRRSQPWYKQANFVDRATGRRMTLGYPGQDPNSKFVYLKEIILVDDNSTLPELKGKLSHYIRTRLPPDLIRILRLPERMGLTLARLRGARSARGAVLVFLDAHCEMAPDWVRPLLQRVRDKRDAVVTPVIEVIDENTFVFIGNDDVQVGGFTFSGHFTWIDIPEREKKRRGSDIAPTWSPTMAGGLFAINREYYWELGAYDEQMAGWGGENLEMSFRIWQCGGTLETIPCSRVGHVFRSFHPYGLPAKSDTHGINTARMAEVWMDDYKELFYMHRPDLRNSPKIGDVTHRKVLREKLQCKSFDWYLANIYKEKFVPVRDAQAYGRFRNPASGLCLDTLQKEGDSAALGVYPCHPTLQATQHFSIDLDGQIRDEERCVQLQFSREKPDSLARRKLILVDCSKKLHPQKWRYTVTKQLIHANTELCLDSGFEAGRDVVAVKCRTAAPTQRWEIDYSVQNGFKLSDHKEMSESELILQKLRGQRRKSRSLLSLTDGGAGSDVNSSKGRRHSHKKRKHKKRSRKHTKAKRSRARRKNKFILRLERTLMNNTADHLEVEIHCKHRKLYPNNSFVRDLVTILNEKNIKVINNGRIFERNRVVQLSHGHGHGKPQDAKVLEKLELDTRAGVLGSPPLSLIDPPQPPAPAPAVPYAPRAPVAPPAPIPQLLRGLTQPPPAPAPTQRSTARMWVAKKHKVRLPQPNVAAKRQKELDPASHKKIIIEDFVEVKPSPTPHPPPLAVTRGRRERKKKRRKEQVTAHPPHPANTAPPDQVERNYRASEDGEMTPSQPASDLAEMSAVDTYSSREPVEWGEEARRGGGRRALDTALRMSMTKDKDSSREDSADSSDQEVAVGRNQTQTQSQTPVKSRRRVRKTTTTPSAEEPELTTSAPRPAADAWSQAFFNETLRTGEGAGTGPDSAPLKVVMKSNVTFNLGSRLLKWRASEDMRKLLGQLSIPDNATEWLQPAPKLKKRAGGRGVARAMDTLTIDSEPPPEGRSGSASSQMQPADADGDGAGGGGGAGDSSYSSSESAGAPDFSDNTL